MGAEYNLYANGRKITIVRDVDDHTIFPIDSKDIDSFSMSDYITIIFKVGAVGIVHSMQNEYVLAFDVDFIGRLLTSKIHDAKFWEKALRLGGLEPTVFFAGSSKQARFNPPLKIADPLLLIHRTLRVLSYVAMENPRLGLNDTGRIYVLWEGLCNRPKEMKLQEFDCVNGTSDFESSSLTHFTQCLFFEKDYGPSEDDDGLLETLYADSNQRLSWCHKKLLKRRPKPLVFSI